MNILVTGGNGFLGKAICRSLSAYTVQTLGRDNNSNYQCDLAKEAPIFDNIFDIVVHAAGKAHTVPGTEQEGHDFYNINVTGTKNLLEGLINASALPKSFVFISSVSVYGLSAGININEDAPLLAKDPYGVSKIQAEILIHNWCLKNNVNCTILRLPLIVGPNPPGNLGAMIKGIMKGYYFNIGHGKAKKSMILAEDVAAVIPLAAEIGGIYNLTDDHHPSFKELSEVIAMQCGKGGPISIPVWLAKLLAMIGDFLGNNAPLNSYKLQKIITDLTFNDAKANRLLRWKPQPVLNWLKHHPFF